MRNSKAIPNTKGYSLTPEAVFNGVHGEFAS